MTHSLRQITLQLIPWSRVDHRFLAKAASTPAMAGARFTPLLYAVEVKQHSWAVALIRQAKQQFKLDAEKQFDVTYAPHDVTAKRSWSSRLQGRPNARCRAGWTLHVVPAILQLLLSGQFPGYCRGSTCRL